MKLFILPDSLIIDTISEWLYTKDVAKFDSAVCSKIFRETMLEFLTSDFSSFHCETTVEIVVKWVVLRNVKLRNVIFSDYSLPQSLNERSISKVTTINMLRVSWKFINLRDEIFKIINKCPLLICLEGCGSDILKINAEILKQLTNIPSIDFKNHLDHVNLHCSNLTVCDILNYEPQLESGEKLFILARNNPNLILVTIFGMSCCPEDFHQLTTHLSKEYLKCQLQNSVPEVNLFMKEIFKKSNKKKFNGFILIQAIPTNNNFGYETIWTKNNIAGYTDCLLYFSPFPISTNNSSSKNNAQILNDNVIKIQTDNQQVVEFSLVECKWIPNDFEIRKYCIKINRECKN
jgi:hypothetical protein